MSQSNYRVVLGVTAGYLGIVALISFLQWNGGAACPWYLSVLAFLPVGILFTMALGRRRWLIAIAFGTLGAAWIEAGQAIWMPEGYGRVEDTVWGALGVVAGTACVLLANRVSKARFMRSHTSFRFMTEGGRREIPQD